MGLKYLHYNTITLHRFKMDLICRALQGLFQAKTEFDFQTLLLMTYFFQKFVLSKQS